jgi:hypothetical protein
MRFLAGILFVVSLLGAGRTQAELPPTGNLSRTNLVAWCIVPFDSKKRGPEERADLLAELATAVTAALPAASTGRRAMPARSTILAAATGGVP